MRRAISDRARRRIIPVQRRYHAHIPGLVYVAVTVFLFVGAINTQNNLLFWALGMALGGILVSGLISGAALMRVEIERTQVSGASVPGPARIVYAVHNRSRFVPLFALTIVELGGRGERGWRRFLSSPRAFVAHVGPGETVHAEAVVWPRRRGHAEFDRLRAWTTFPFGIARKSVTFSQPQRVLIRPAVAPLRESVLRGLDGRGLAGISASKTTGLGDEFYGLREYFPGDSPRFIAWRATARTGELVTRLHASPSPARLWVCLDVAGAIDDDHIERAVSLAASVIRHAHDRGMEVGLIAGRGAGAIAVHPRRGGRCLSQMVDDLALFVSEDGMEQGAPLELPGGGRSVLIVAAPQRNADDSRVDRRSALVLSATETARMVDRSRDSLPADWLAGALTPPPRAGWLAALLGLGGRAA